MIESSKSTDAGICHGLSFLWNAESPKNLQQTKAEEAGNSESIGDSDKFPDALWLSSSMNTAVLGLDRIGRSTSIIDTEFVFDRRAIGVQLSL